MWFLQQHIALLLWVIVRVIAALLKEKEFLLLKEQQSPEQSPTQKACFSCTKTILSVICACVLTGDLKLARTRPLLLRVWFLQHKSFILGWVLVRVLVGILMTNVRSGAIWWLHIQTRSGYIASCWYEFTLHLTLGSNVCLESRVRAVTIDQILSVQSGAR